MSVWRSGKAAVNPRRKGALVLTGAVAGESEHQARVHINQALVKRTNGEDTSAAMKGVRGILVLALPAGSGSGRGRHGLSLRQRRRRAQLCQQAHPRRQVHARSAATRPSRSRRAAPRAAWPSAAPRPRPAPSPARRCRSTVPRTLPRRQPRQRQCPTRRRAWCRGRSIPTSRTASAITPARRRAASAGATAMRTIKYSFMETCYACGAKPGVNFGTLRLNTAAYQAEIARRGAAITASTKRSCARSSMPNRPTTPTRCRGSGRRA